MKKAGVEMAAFRSREVAKLFGITLRQLDYWVRSGLIEPSILPSEGRGAQRVFGFLDLVQVRTIKALIEGGMSIQKIRKSIAFLKKELGIDLPLTARLVTDGKSILRVAKTNNELIQAIDTLHHGQGVFFVPIGRSSKR